MRAHPTGPRARLTVAEMLTVGALRGAEEVFLADGGGPVEHLVLAGELPRLRELAPNTVVVLHGEAASGGWSLASALHMAWERHAAAVVTPRVALSRSAALLARRLDITVLAVDRDPVEVALALAAEVARPEAERARRVAACAELLARESTVRGVLGVLNAELAGVPVALLVDGGLVAGRAAALRPGRGLTDVRVDVPGPAGRRWAELVAAVPEPSDGYAEYVPTLLRLARAPLLAASARGRIETARRTAREQAAFRLLREGAEHGQAADGGPPAAGAQAPPDREPPVWTSELGWRVEGDNTGLWIADPAGAQGPPAPERTTMMRAAWAERLSDLPLVADQGGWLSWWNQPRGTPGGGLPKRLRALVGDVARAHGAAVGVGSPLPGAAGLLRSLREARLAAGAAAADGPGGVREFGEAGVAAALAALPVGHLVAVADLVFPALADVRDREQIVRTVLAVLDHGGSLHQAATRLGVHRNTVLARLKRARELGLAYDDPAGRLAVHVLCHALAADGTGDARQAEAPPPATGPGQGR
ncbi:helix-turn-helix domain-containing protein [Streptomyces buecherae]|uniref:Helix-turn-helix domain-containing protein n=1 Tax=Streptomyces buecherae TaxID=2763006 RepID=A0A7H8NG54_9ACTN|nr:helix-turn-helix domain-containing protein [Streptomyces buecherae]QKW53452.1 helix-turn-helix domain-containing protein [Streptomyces buecherae]